MNRSGKLKFDPEHANYYLKSFQLYTAKALMIDEVEHLFDEKPARWAPMFGQPDGWVKL